MATITVTTDGQTVFVSNGDTVVIDIPGGGTTNILAEPGSKVNVFRIKFVDDNQADTVVIDLKTFSSYGLHIDIIDYDETDTVSLLSAYNTHVDAGNEDEYQFQYFGVGNVQFDGYIRAKDKGEQDFTANPAPVIICFGEGTSIDTDLGPTPIECLKPGDLVKTRDRGLQPVQWVGRRVLDTLDLARNPQLCPVRFKAGSLGADLPYRDLTVSPQHRMLLADWRTELNFGELEVLCPALNFVNNCDVVVMENLPSVTYYHLLFEVHEIVMANGVPTESLFLGEMALLSMTNAAKDELKLIFPDAPSEQITSATARPVARKFEAQSVLSSAA